MNEKWTAEATDNGNKNHCNRVPLVILYISSIEKHEKRTKAGPL